MIRSTRFPSVNEIAWALSGKKPSKLMAGMDGTKNELPDATCPNKDGTACCNTRMQRITARIMTGVVMMDKDVMPFRRKLPFMQIPWRARYLCDTV